MYPTAQRPAFGRFVADQVQALRKLPEIELTVHVLSGGSPASYVRAAAELRRQYRGERFDVVHAHFGLSAWPALAVRASVHGVTLHGTDLSHPRSRAITLAALPMLQIVGTVSAELAQRVPRWATRRTHLRSPEVLPCGVDIDRFQRIDRVRARTELGLAPDRPYLLFPSDPARGEKRFDLARQLAGEIELLTLGDVAPERVPLYVNAANAVLVTSDREGFGLATLEALACDVPVLATPHGIAPEALAGVHGTLCAPFDLTSWGAVLAPHLAAADPRIAGRAAAERYSAATMAQRIADAWRSALAR
jgi:glycosyltransferase involved in cell wall biosynthesis